MWEHRCQATTTRGKRCRRQSTTAVWTFAFESERYSSATWVETCTHHMPVGGTVTQLDIRRPKTSRHFAGHAH
jgi:hypothetical protein